MILTTSATHTFIPSMLHNHTILLIFPQKSTWCCCRSVAHAPRTFPFPGHALRHGCLHSWGVWQLVVSGPTFLTFIWPWWNKKRNYSIYTSRDCWCSSSISNYKWQCTIMATNGCCSACGTDFVKKNKRFNRTSATALGSQRVLQSVFPGLLTPYNVSFICDDCKNVFCRKTLPIRGKGIKRKLPTFPHNDCLESPIQHLPNKLPRVDLQDCSKIDDPCKNGPTFHEKRSHLCERAIEYLTDYKYLAAFRNLTKASKTAKMALIQVATEIVKQEVGINMLKPFIYISTPT